MKLLISVAFILLLKIHCVFAPEVVRSGASTERTVLRDEMIGLQLVRKGGHIYEGEGVIGRLLTRPGEVRKQDCFKQNKHSHLLLNLHLLLTLNNNIIMAQLFHQVLLKFCAFFHCRFWPVLFRTFLAYQFRLSPCPASLAALVPSLWCLKFNQRPLPPQQEEAPVCCQLCQIHQPDRFYAQPMWPLRNSLSA